MLMTEGLEHPTYPILRESGVAVVAGTEWLNRRRLVARSG